MDAHVSRQIPDLGSQVDHLRRDVLDLGRVGQPVPVADLLAPRVLLALREAQGAGHVAHRDPPAVGDDVGDLGGVVAAVFVVDVLDDLFALVGFDVHVDVGRPVAGGRQEPLEQQLVGHRIDGGDTQGITDRGVGRRSPALTQDVVVPTEPGDVVHHQEIARKIQLCNDFQLVFDLRVRSRRPLGGPVAVARARHRQLPQPAVLGVPVGHVERRQLRRDQRQPERALLAEFGRSAHHLGPLREQPGHLLTGPQVRTTQRSQPPGGSVQGLPGPDRAHRHGQPSARRMREMRCGGGDDVHAEPPRQPGQRGIAFVVERLAVMGQLDADPACAEPVHQIGQRPPRRIRTTLGKRLAHMAFAASGQDVPVPAGRLGQRIEVVARLALLAAGQVRGGQLPRQAPVAFRAAGQHQQMRAGRVRLLGAGARPQRQFGAEDGTHVKLRGRFGEPHRAVQAVVVGQRQRTQIQPGGLLDQLLRRAGAVEKAVRRMRMQLGVRDGGPGHPLAIGRLIPSALARQGNIIV